MVSLEQCKRILKADGSKYTDEEVRLIRDYLYKQTSIHQMIIDNLNSVPDQPLPGKYENLKDEMLNYGSNSFRPVW